MPSGTSAISSNALDPLGWIDEELDALDALDLLRRPRPREGGQGAIVSVDGRPLVNFSSNDYLGLASDVQLREAVTVANFDHGWGSGASPLIFGRGPMHEALEQRLAEFEGTDAAMIFSSGYTANIGAITALAGRGDAVFSDQKNHASIIDGCRLSGARVQIYPHGDCDYLEKMLAQASTFRRRMIVTDTLFSMDGDIAPLADLADLAERHDAMLLVDEAHATGVFGERGRGLCEQAAVEDRVHVRVGTLSKALGCGGGFVVGSQPLIDYLTNRARSYVFSTAPPAPWCAAVTAALEVVEQEPQRRMDLLAHAADLRDRLAAQGWQTGESDSQIIPVFVGEPAATMRLAELLEQRGLLIPGIRPPSVPEGESLLRISLTFAHTSEMIDQLVEAMGEVQNIYATNP